MDLSAIADAVKSFAQEGTTFIYLAAMTAGIVLGLSAILKIAKKGMDRGDQASLSWAGIAVRLVISSCLVTMASKLRMIISTNGETQALQSVMGYARGAANTQADPVMQAIWAACSTFLVFMGTLAFMRGLLKLDKASQGAQDSGDAFWAGLWHIIGGAVTVSLFR